MHKWIWIIFTLMYGSTAHAIIDFHLLKWWNDANLEWEAYNADL